MAREMKKEDLIEKHCELIDVYNGYKEYIDLKYALMLEQELKLAGTILTHITSEEDKLQLEHMTEYLATTEEFLANLWKGKMHADGKGFLDKVWAATYSRLELYKDKMELKYSSEIFAELKIAESMIRNHDESEKMASEHIYAFLCNIDRHIDRLMKLQPGYDPKK